MAKRRAVLISGASTGIGRQCAIDLAQRPAPYLVFAGVRDQYEPFECANIVPLRLDITREEEIRHAKKQIAEALDQTRNNTPEPIGLYALINNAGVAMGGPLEEIPLDTIREQFEVNVFGQIAMTQTFLPMLRQYASSDNDDNASSHIINIGSIAGRSCLPFASPYSASKHALKAFSDALRLELGQANIQVSLLEPGVIETPIWQKSLEKASGDFRRVSDKTRADYGPKLEKLLSYLAQAPSRGVPASTVSRVVVHILESGRGIPRKLIGNDAILGSLFHMLPVSWTDYMIQKRLF
ncbi:MAG: SDR family NAD(P)-dependent oxidoreductase [Vampirovibrionales bacterium]|nr:SDR family NAD(P)-dependent oxidoreductase [Vampirovibrionales bacterium]